METACCIHRDSSFWSYLCSGIGKPLNVTLCLREDCPAPYECIILLDERQLERINTLKEEGEEEGVFTLSVAQVEHVRKSLCSLPSLIATRCCIHRHNNEKFITAMRSSFCQHSGCERLYRDGLPIGREVHHTARRGTER